MEPRTTTSSRAADRRGRAGRSRRRPPAAVRRPGVYLGMAAAGAVMVNVLVGTDPAARAEVATSESVSVARQLGLTAQSGPVQETPDLRPLEQLAASRSTREAAQTAAQQTQAAAEQAELDRRKAEADAARAAAEASAAAARQAEQAAVQRTPSAPARPAGPAPAPPTGAAPAATAAAPTGAVARISNSAGNVKPSAQAAANMVVAHVPGVDGITIGGTRASATDPHGHPSGLALDYMVGSDAALGDAVVEYHIAHWAELGVQYVIWQQRMLSSPTGSWKPMENRGSATANHMDHPHVNYLG